MNKISLNGEWKGTGIAPNGETLHFSAAVPGCVHTDMLKIGKIPNPFWRDNSKACAWIENLDWVYEREFEYIDSIDIASEDVFITFCGLDTYCDIILNDIKIASAENMFIPHSFCINRILNHGKNKIKVYFRSPIKAIEHMPKRDGHFTTERLNTRRMQCTYGWDWVDRFVTCGIFDDVFIERKSACEIDNVHIYTQTVDEKYATVEINVILSNEDAKKLFDVIILSPNGTEIFHKSGSAVEKTQYFSATVKNPELWFPRGYGQSPLYELIVRLYDDSGMAHNEYKENFGIRTVRIIEIEDTPESEYYQKCIELKKSPQVSNYNSHWDRNSTFSGFILQINNINIMCKGACWVPCEPFPSEVSRGKIRNILETAAEANVNMIRVWGGGMFEKDFFYDECDRLGIMVTQDFLMACGNYPDNEQWFLNELKKEAVFAVLKLRNHPCLVWWSGDNENAVAADDCMPQYPGRSVVRNVIEPIIKKLDYTRPFLPSSPYGGVPFGSITYGTTHNTNFLGTMFAYIKNTDMKDYKQYFEQYLSRFVAEAPTMGFCSINSMLKFLSYDDIFMGDESMLRFHTKNNPHEYYREVGLYDYMRMFAQKIMGGFKDTEDMIYKMQAAQYEWVRITLELYRRNKWFSSGVIFWMLNDCWPASGSWSLIDYYGTPKAAYYAFKRAAKNVICSINCKNEKCGFFVSNDSLNKFSGKMTIYALYKDEIHKEEIDFSVGENTTRLVLETDKFSSLINDGAFLVCDICGENFCDRAFYTTGLISDANVNFTKPEICDRDEKSVTVFSKGLSVFVNLGDNVIYEDNYFVMLPGEKRKVKYRRYELE